MSDEEPKPEDIKKKYYINSKEFRQLIVDFYDSGDETPCNELVEGLQKIAEGLSFNWRFIKYTQSWKEDMVGDAIIKMYAAMKKKQFNIESTYNPYSYFNAIAWNAFSNRIKKENRQHKGLLEYRQQVHDEFMSDPNNQTYAKPVNGVDEEEFYNE
jgi:DNA-directed RNA polymerase specialized sigma24 family protein